MEEQEINSDIDGTQLTSPGPIISLGSVNSLGPIISPDAIMEPEWTPRVPPKRTRRLLVAVAAVAVLLAAVATVYVTGGSGTPSATPSPSAAHPSSSAVSVPPAAATGPDLSTLNGMLLAQDNALKSGDQKGFLSFIDPKAHAAITEYKRIFRNMRAMKVKAWNQSSISGRAAITGTAAYPIDADYCLATIDCTLTRASYTVTVKLHNGRARIEAIKVPKRDLNTDAPAPWLVSDLSALTAPRIVVAASRAEAGRLKSALAAAKRAAVVADGLAGVNRPAVYVVYLASSSEARVWLGGEPKPSRYLSSTFYVSRYDIEEVLFMPQAANYDAGPGRIEATLRFGFAQVAGSYGKGWVAESSLSMGLFEFAEASGHADWAHIYFSGVRSYIRSGKWSGSLNLTKPFTASGSDSSRAAAIGIGYLTMRRLDERFGKAKMLAFWSAVVRDGESPSTVSQTVFGKSWASVTKDCGQYIRDMVGA